MARETFTKQDLLDARARLFAEIAEIDHPDGFGGEDFPCFSADVEPAPAPNDRPAVWDLVIADMRARDAFGRKKYGTPLQAHNGRDALVDAYQEALDLAVYLRQAIEERS